MCIRVVAAIINSFQKYNAKMYSVASGTNYEQEKNKILRHYDTRYPTSKVFFCCC